jgi:hypothetical protein
MEQTPRRKDVSGLFVVSDRVVLPGVVQAGGLEVALHGVLKKRHWRVVWMERRIR